VDGVMIGPMDLSGSLGIPGQTNHPDVIEASKKVIRACEKYGKSCGTQVSDTTESAITDLFDLGYTFAILGSDLFVLWRWAENMKVIMEKLK
jgi:2-dehydro-3-deoxyglucarate aldolase